MTRYVLYVSVALSISMTIVCCATHRSLTGFQLQLVDQPPHPIAHLATTIAGILGDLDQADIVRLPKRVGMVGLDLSRYASIRFTSEHDSWYPLSY